MAISDPDIIKTIKEARELGPDPVRGPVKAIHPHNVEFGDSKRKDAGKLRGFWLLPSRPLSKVAEVYAIGAEKYSPRGWEGGMEWSRVVDPMFRHLFKWLRGERYDSVDGQHHLAAVVWACLTLMEYEETHPTLDDLHRDKIGKTISEVAPRELR